MGISDYEKGKQDEQEILSESIRSSSHIIASTLIAAFGGVPLEYAAIGAGLIQFIGLRGKLKVNRALKFTEAFMKYIQENSQDMDTAYMQSEDFSDFFEEILTAVTKTSSEEKLKRFRNILINQVEEKIEIDKAKRFAKLIDNMEEKQIELLCEWTSFSNLRKEINNKRETISKKLTKLKNDNNLTKSNSIKKEINNLESNLEESKMLYDELNNKIGIYYDSYEQGDIQYLSADLLAKGLIATGAATGSNFGKNTFSVFSVTTSANDFIKFISNKN